MPPGSFSVLSQDSYVEVYIPHAPDRARGRCRRKGEEDKLHGLPPEDNTQPAEVCDVLGPGWFWTSKENASNLKTAEHVVNLLDLCNRRRANYLLNVGPDKTAFTGPIVPPSTNSALVELCRLSSLPRATLSAHWIIRRTIGAMSHWI